METLHLDNIIVEYFCNSVGTDKILKALNLDDSYFEKVSQLMGDAQREYKDEINDDELDQIIIDTEANLLSIYIRQSALSKRKLKKII